MQMQCYVNTKKVLNNTKPCKTCVQKLVLGKSKYDSASQTLQQLHWLLSQDRIHHKILTLTHRCSYGQAPEYLKNLTEIRGKHDRNMYSNQKWLTTKKSLHQAPNLCIMFIQICCISTVEWIAIAHKGN